MSPEISFSENKRNAPFSSGRLLSVDTLKAVSSQLIVLHHLAFYGPMSDIAYPLAPGLFSWLSRYGRMAVPVFLVTAGFLSASHFIRMQGATALSKPWSSIGRRYLRLVVPYAVALVAAIFCAALARTLISHTSIPGPPTFSQILAHLFLLQDILGLDALSAGIWYVAIDFQLFAFTVLMLWLCGKLASRLFSSPMTRQRLAIIALAASGLASLFFFNRSSRWDVSFIYFLVYYVIGIAAWLIASASSKRHATAGLFALTLIVAVALVIDYRIRIAVALATAWILALTPCFDCCFFGKRLHNRTFNGVITCLGKISYSVFLIHFPVCLVINAVFFHYAPDSPWINMAGIVFAWATSLAGGALLYHCIEKRVQNK